MDTGSGKTYSTIAFPYFDLDDAITVARAAHDAGGVPLDRDQLAAAMGQVPTSGNFNGKVSAARLFGLITNSQGRYQLSELGFEVLDPGRERAAKAEAFLNVPLYRRAYDTYKGKQLPPRPVGLENAFVNFGVSSKQKDKARHAFDRSARSAGFFPNGTEDRLVQPVTGTTPASIVEELTRGVAPEVPVQPESVPFTFDMLPGRPAPRGLNPFIEGLLEELPPKGEAWSIEDQANWLQAAAQIFRILYKGDGEIVVTVKKGGL